jgi:geranylgeranyl pyrophosphate synthase
MTIMLVKKKIRIPRSIEIPTMYNHDPISDCLRVGLFQPVETFLAQRGKGLRTKLIQICYRLAGGREDVPMELVDAVEYLHAGSLIVDDIQDGSDFRRGQPTLHRRIGLPLALNAGNWMYFRALELLDELPMDSPGRHRLLGLAVATVRECHEGQALDLATKLHELDQQDFLTLVHAISRRKTGALASLSARMGAMIAGASLEREESLASFGSVFGLCLQMQNDLDELRSIGSQRERRDDLRNLRVTWPWAWYAAKSPPDQFKALQLRAILALKDTDAAESIAAVILEQIGQSGDHAIRNTLQREFESIARIAGDRKQLNELSEFLEMMNSLLP